MGLYPGQSNDRKLQFVCIQQFHVAVHYKKRNQACLLLHHLIE